MLAIFPGAATRVPGKNKAHRLPIHVLGIGEDDGGLLLTRSQPVSSPKTKKRMAERPFAATVHQKQSGQLWC